MIFLDFIKTTTTATTIILFEIFLVSASSSNILENRCSMFGQCGPYGAGCPYSGPPIQPAGFSENLGKLCGSKFSNGSVCCDIDQFESLESNMKIAFNIIGGCPACWKNFLDFWCEFTCSSSQSSFVNVTSTISNPSTGKMYIGAVDYFVSPSFGTGFYDSCKNVKFGADNSFAMDLLGGGAKNYLEMMEFLGSKKPLIGSPIDIDFPIPLNNQSCLDLPPVSCDSPGFACPCIDCDKTCPVLDAPVIENCSAYGVDCRQIIAVSLFLVLCTSLGALLLIRWLRSINSTRAQISNIEENTPLIPVEQSINDENTIEEAGSSSNSRHQKVVTFSSIETEVSQQPSFNVFFVQQYFNYPLNSWLEKMFYELGLFVSTRPLIVIMSTGCLLALMSFGIMSLQVETDPINLWVNPNSRVYKEKQIFDQAFGPFYRTEQVILTMNNDSSAFTRSTARKIFEILSDIQDFKSGPITEFCFQPLKDGNCVIQSLAAYWGNSLVDFEKASQTEESFQNAALNCLKSPTDCLPPYMQPLRPEFVLGGYRAPDFINAKALILTLVMNNYNDKEDVMKTMEWENELISYLDEKSRLLSTQGIQLSFMTENSIEKELNRESTADIPTILWSYIVMFIYASIALGKSSFSKRIFVESRFGIGLVGIILVIFSVLSAVGLFSMMGRKVTLIIAEVIPFLVLAIGVDNIFILVHAMDRETIDSLPPLFSVDVPSNQADMSTLLYRRPAISVHYRIARALSKMGPSILLASLTEIFAFALGTLSGLPAVKNFALLAAMSIFINFLLQITVFISFLSLDTRRREDGRLDLLPFIKTNIRCMFRDGILSSFFKYYYAPFILNPAVKALVLALFSSMFVVGLTFMNRVPLGLDQRIALPRDSYLIPYFNNLEIYFNVGPPLYWVVSGINASDIQGQSTICSRAAGCSKWSVTNILEQERKRSDISYMSQPVASWIDDFIMWVVPNSECCMLEIGSSQDFCEPEDSSSSCASCLSQDRNPFKLDEFPKGKEFDDLLVGFLDQNPSMACPTAGAAAYSSAIGKTEQNLTISHFRTFHSVLRTQNDFISAYKAARKISNEISSRNQNLSIFPYSIFYVFFDQYLNIQMESIMLLVLCFISIFITSSLFLGSFKLALIVTSMVAMITVDLVGVMYFWNIELNGITLVNIIICTGISVEFCSHVTRAFLITSPRHKIFAEGIFMTGSRNRRTYVALVEVGSSVFSGITITKFLGISILALAQSRIFEVYYFRMYFSIVVLAFLHGLVLLPVILSLFGNKHVVRTGLYSSEREGQLFVSSGRPFSMYAEIVDQAFED